MPTTIGVHGWERKVRQTLRVDLELGQDLRAAGKSDALEQALDYEAVAARVAQAGVDSAFQLVEAFAEHLATLLLKEFKLHSIKLAVWKPAALPGAEAVGIVIARGAK